MSENDTILLLRRSWSQAIADREMMGRLFYSKLFQIAPETEALFKEDMDTQARKLVATLAFIIDSLDEEEALLNAARDLAVRHVDYKVTAEQYSYVGEALIATLKEMLGAKFDEPTETAWADTYGALSDHMISSAYA